MNLSTSILFLLGEAGYRQAYITSLLSMAFWESRSITDPNGSLIDFWTDIWIWKFGGLF